MAFENIKKQVATVEPDLIEILPGVMPKVIKRICSQINVPVIAGGLIADKEDVMAILDAGAVSISTTNETVWFM
jgi:glycerol-3-phosphate responsive antiterminator